MRRLLSIVPVAATIITATIGAWRISTWNTLPTLPEDHQPRVVPDWERYSPLGSGAVQDDPVVTMVVFSDYLCGYCATALSTVEELARRYPKGIEVAWRQFPVLGSRSGAAAIASHCGYRVGKFREMHRRLFSQVDSFGVKSWAQIASEAGVGDTVEFSTCLSSDAAAEAIRLDAEAARELGLSGVPGVLLDSLLFRGLPPRRYLETYIRRTLAAR